MRGEAEITVNGTKLRANQSKVVRLALATLADILANDFGFKDDGIPLTDQYHGRSPHPIINRPKRQALTVGKWPLDGSGP
jgi:hypothetical protein